MIANVRRNRITTNRLILRPFEKGDIRAVHEYASDEEVCRFVPWGPNSFKDTEQFIKGLSAPERSPIMIIWAITPLS